MRVKSIVIDGFKSYAHRKELENLSPHFNAITGLNGSGKSNIFDAICFVMGITNLKKVRAEDPRELIFRAGTTGVHAARVTLEFINDDPATAPPGYSCEEYPIITVGRQIKIGGKQQFFFNNTVSMQSKVKRFFESISLNVDNPHFMVLQGTVHKLIGMRSQDILSLIEEAVGTKAFDHRRRTAESLIRNKEKKIEEIDNNINTQIGPMLDAMRADQEEYNKFLHATEGLEERKKFRIAFEYYEKSEEVEQHEQVIAAKNEDISRSKEMIKRIPEQEEELSRRLVQLQESMSAPSETTIALHEEESELKKVLVRQQSSLEGVEKQLKQLEHTLKQLRKEKEKQNKSQENFQSRREQHEQLLLEIKNEKEKIKQLKEALQLMESGVRAGVSGLSLEEEKSQLDVKLVKANATIKRCKQNVQNLTEQLRRVQQSKVEQRDLIKSAEKDLAAAQRILEKEEELYRPLAPLESRSAELLEAIATKKKEYQRLFENFQREGGNQQFDLDYDRSRIRRDVAEKVLGRVGELITPKDDTYSLGLMVGSQNMLLRVVVEDDSVAEDIIKCGLRQRTSFLALNKLQQNHFIDGKKAEEAKQIAKRMNGTVHIARDLVEVADKSLGGLVDFVFGSFFVCSNLELAQELAYNPKVRAKSVTLEGEIAEPNGLMTGGSNTQLRNLFDELKTYKNKKGPLNTLKQEIDGMDQEYRSIRDKFQNKKGIIASYKAADEKVEMLKQRLQIIQNQAEEAVTDIETKLKEAQATLAEAEAQVVEYTARKDAINKEASVDEGRARADLQSKLSKAESHLVKLIQEEEKGSAEFERLEADLEQDAAGLATKIKDCEDDYDQCQAEKARLMQDIKVSKDNVADVQARRKQSEEQRIRLEKDIDETQEEKTRLMERKVALDNLVRNAEVDLKEASKGFESARNFLRDCDRRHSWIAAEKGNFGPANGPFYFTDTARTQQTLSELRDAEAQSAVMSKRVTQKTTVLYEDRKKEYDELVQQRAALGEDKEAIHACIRGIEYKKWTSLDRMVSVVSNIFGKLFATCLPGASAELVEERDEQQHLCGLSVCVKFNGKPKESLSELSGGQRSLLALCLILSILRVRPAPIYILDEVDAALDPSHTQNIGLMLQRYFPNSQFLLVSLKDGMFNSANVLYHIRNTQGYSEVARIEHSKNNENNESTAGGESQGKVKRKDSNSVAVV